MGATTLVPVEEYLATSYEPDCEYVDGALVERNVGELDHSDLQSEIVAWFRARRTTLRIFAFAGLRVQVSPTRFRVLDVCLVHRTKPSEPILRTPPLAVIEIVSKDDRMTAMQEKIDDYLAFGVRYVWFIDPRTRRAFIYASDGAREAKDGILRTQNPNLELPLPEVFANLE